MNFIVLIEEFNNYDTGEERFIVKKIIEYKTEIYETEDDNIDGYVVPSGWKLRDSELIEEKKSSLVYASWSSDNSINDTIKATTNKSFNDVSNEDKIFPSYAINNTDVIIERKQFEPYSPFDYLFSIVKSVLLLDPDKKFIINDVDEDFEIPLIGIDPLLNNNDYLVYNYNNTDKYFKPTQTINSIYYYSNRIKFYFKTKQINSRFGSEIKFNKNQLRYLTPNVNTQGNIANRIYINSKNDYFEITDFTYVNGINCIQIRDSNGNIINFAKLVSIGYNFNKLGDLDNLYFVYNNGIVVELFVIGSVSINGGSIDGSVYGLDSYKNRYLNLPVIKSETFENFAFKSGILPDKNINTTNKTLAELFPDLSRPEIWPTNIIIPINSETYTVLFDGSQLSISELIIKHRKDTTPNGESNQSLDDAFTNLKSFLKPSDRTVDPKLSYLIYVASYMQSVKITPDKASFSNDKNTGGAYNGSSIIGLRFSIIDDFINKYKILLSKESFKKVTY